MRNVSKSLSRHSSKKSRTAKSQSLDVSAKSRNVLAGADQSSRFFPLSPTASVVREIFNTCYFFKAHDQQLFTLLFVYYVSFSRQLPEKHFGIISMPAARQQRCKGCLAISYSRSRPSYVDYSGMV